MIFVWLVVCFFVVFFNCTKDLNGVNKFLRNINTVQQRPLYSFARAQQYPGKRAIRRRYGLSPSSLPFLLVFGSRWDPTDFPLPKGC